MNQRHNFYNELLTSNELLTLPDTFNENPNNSFNILHHVIQNAKAKHMPTKFIKYDKYKHKRSKWITSGIIKSIQYRDNLYKKLKRTNHNSIQLAIHKTNLDAYNNILKKSIRLAKRNYYQTIFSKFNDDIRCTWKIINEILSRTKRRKTFPLFFKDGDNIVTNKELIANKFNSIFTNIGTTLSQQIKAPQNKSFKSNLTKKYNNTLTFQSTSEETIGQIIDKLAPNTSFGFDGISIKLLKTIKDAIIKDLTVIINQILNTGIFPEK